MKCILKIDVYEYISYWSKSLNATLAALSPGLIYIFLCVINMSIKTSCCCLVLKQPSSCLKSGTRHSSQRSSKRPNTWLSQLTCVVCLKLLRNDENCTLHYMLGLCYLRIFIFTFSFCTLFYKSPPKQAGTVTWLPFCCFFIFCHPQLDGSDAVDKMVPHFYFFLFYAFNL